MNVMEQCNQVNIIDCNLYILLVLSNMVRWIFDTCNFIKSIFLLFRVFKSLLSVLTNLSDAYKHIIQCWTNCRISHFTIAPAMVK